MLISSFRSEEFYITVYDSLDEVVSERWNRINPDVLLSNYLSFIEDSKPLDLEFRYIIVESELNGIREVCAIIYLQHLKFTAKNIHLKDSLFLSALASIILSFRSFRIHICGNLFAVNFPSIQFIGEIISRHSLLSIIAEVGRKEKYDAFFLKDIDESFGRDEMDSFGWTPYETDMTMTLDILPFWKTINDYNRSLKKKYRKRSENIIEAGRKMLRRDMSDADIQKYSAEIKKLFGKVSSRQSIRMGLIGEDYFYEFRKRFPDAFRFVGYFLGEKLVAFSTYIDHGEDLEVHYIGIDYSMNNELKIYFNILMDGVDRAIHLGKKRLELGRTAREAKANLGCKPVYFNDYFRIENRIAKRLIKWFGKYFSERIGENWMERHPFRV